MSAETGPDHSKCSTTKLSGQVNNSNEPLTFQICDLLIYGYMESGRILGELTLKRYDVEHIFDHNNILHRLKITCQKFHTHIHSSKFYLFYKYDLFHRLEKIYDI